MTRHFRILLTLTALAATLAMHGSALAGKGFSLGGGGGGGGSRGNFSGAMRSHQGGGSSMRSLSMHQGRSPANRVMKQHVQHRSPASNFNKHLSGQVMNRTIGNVNPNVVQGNIRNPLLGNASGVSPKHGGHIGRPQSRGPVQGGLGHGVGSHGVGGQIQRGIAKHGGGHGHGGMQVQGRGGKFHSTSHRHGKADCRHVIDMLVRHCVGNRTYDPCVKQHCPDPSWVQFGWIPAPPMPVVVDGVAAGDLELVEVGMLSDATPDQGPVYQVTLRNVGSIDAEQFRVSLVAVLGEIAEDSPSVTVNVDRLAAGESATLQIPLPMTVMALGPQGEEASAFDTMVVAIDSFDELLESNELNNVATLKRTEVELIQVGVTAVEEAPAAVQEGPAEEVQAAPGGAPSGAPAPQEGAAPPATEEIDIDNLELDDADGARELFTR